MGGTPFSSEGLSLRHDFFLATLNKIICYLRVKSSLPPLSFMKKEANSIRFIEVLTNDPLFEYMGV